VRGKLALLVRLYLNRNRLTGNLPNSFGTLTLLLELDFSS